MKKIKIIKSSTILIFIILTTIQYYNSAYAISLKERTPKIENKTTEMILKTGIDELFDHQWPDISYGKLSDLYPKINIQELNDSYHVEAELLGVKKDEVELKLKDDFLVISGEKKSYKEEIKDQYRRIERSNGSFYRSISLPRDIDRNKISAELSDGLLKVDIAKTRGVKKTEEKKILIR